MKENSNFKIRISIFIIWLFAISGIIGVSSSAQDWFLSMTPLNLLLSLAMVLWHIKNYNYKVILALAIPFFIGFIAEGLGVNFGLIFGTYVYGENLGFKVFGVPLMICINWTLLTATTADVSKYFSKNIVISALVGAALMTGLDVILEVSAPRFDFWEFENGIVPIKNYIGWFVTAFIAHLGYQSFKVETNRVISWHVLVSIIIFFSVFLFI
ncbi:carotenoid biosynthesis protein [Winogradskyella sp. UBA3174]|uniref:carotenoid biosynthesis protein n=1 Tax=Winogradskyella sp. UBA3174 TaxID=1947785 RepID=UPI0025F08342|nr:carotenoid biosynthesis protein [Winogradskyella sp. UBA3174]|tara:strand:+ start:2168 stop:2803 length:636 start_codon:yes stop_codon:yes gene_type:complete